MKTTEERDCLLVYQAPAIEELRFSNADIVEGGSKDIEYDTIDQEKELDY